MRHQVMPPATHAAKSMPMKLCSIAPRRPGFHFSSGLPLVRASSSSSAGGGSIPFSA
jgi:hypothetical protein